MHDLALSQWKAQSGKFISKSGVEIIFKTLCIISNTRNFMLLLAATLVCRGDFILSTVQLNSVLITCLQ